MQDYWIVNMKRFVEERQTQQNGDEKDPGQIGLAEEPGMEVIFSAGLTELICVQIGRILPSNRLSSYE